MSGRANIFHIAPTTFQGIKSGMDIKTKQNETPIPFFGIVKAIAMPNGISMKRIMPVYKNCLPKAL